jgi:hypothetical protein
MNVTNDYSMVVKHKKIWDFYNTHTNVDFETANLLLVNFMETLFNNTTNDIGDNINSQLLAFMKDSQLQMNTLTDRVTVVDNKTETITECVHAVNKNVNTLSSDMNDKMTAQMNTIKAEYIKEVTSIIETASCSSREKISELLDKTNNVLIDRSQLLLVDIIPKNNVLVDVIVKENLKNLRDTITSDAPHINSQDAQREFLSTLENKLNNVIQNNQQQLNSTLNASEQRSTTILNTIKDATANSVVSHDKSSKELERTLENQLNTVAYTLQQSTTVLNTLKENVNNSAVSQNKLSGEIEGFLGKSKNSAHKGKLGEEALSKVLHSLYNSAEITNTTGSKASGDFIMKRMDKPDVMIENKEYSNNIPKEEVSKFIRDIDTLNMSGIFISQHSGIAFKQNFQIDINKGNVLVYIQKCDYNSESIRTAFDIIDNLSVKLNEFYTDDGSSSISKDILDDINGDYRSFISQKESMQTLLKDFTKRLNTQIEDLALPSLDKYLEPKYAYIKDRFFKCDMCDDFSGKSKLALGAHKRACKKKQSRNILLGC